MLIYSKPSNRALFMNRIKNILLPLILLLLASCKTMPPSTTTLNAHRSLNQISSLLSASGYEIKNQQNGVLQVFRPMTGTFAKPGYGHRVTVRKDTSGKLVLTVFPIAGVTGGETPAEIQAEVLGIIQ